MQVYESSVRPPPPPIVTNISSGRCERPQQKLSFIITVLDWCVGIDCSDTSLGESTDNNDIERIFDGGSHQLFKGPNSSAISVSSNFSLLFSLVPHRNGRVLLSVSLSDGNLTLDRQITVVVEPVNSPPFFNLSSDVLSFHQDLSLTLPSAASQTAPGVVSDQVLYRDAFLFSISAGDFEAHQRLKFGARSVSNTGLVTCLEVACNISAPPRAGCKANPGLGLTWAGDFASCNDTAMLRLWYDMPWYDEEEIEIVLYDDGPMEPKPPGMLAAKVHRSAGPAYMDDGWLGAPAPRNNHSRALTIRMIKEQFRLASSVVQVLEDSTCFSLPPFGADLSHGGCNRTYGLSSFEHVRAGFVLDVPLQQQATFFVTAAEPSRSPPVDKRIFSQLPSISTDGTLRFTLTPNAFGATNFTVHLQAIDLQQRRLTSNNVSFVLEVININDRPNVVIPPRIIGFESEVFKQVVGTRVSRDTEGNAQIDWEYDQTLTLSVQAGHPDLFAKYPKIRERGLQNESVSVELEFEPVLMAYGTTSLAITVMDDGGTYAGGQDTTSLVVELEIVAVNQAPDFEISESIFVFESPQRYLEPNFAFNVSAGPANERGVCDQFPGNCQKQDILFELESLSNPKLFADLPSVDVSGQLSFRGCRYCTGSASFCMIALDTGTTFASFHNCVPCSDGMNVDEDCCYAGHEESRVLGTNSSAPKCAHIHIEPVDDSPGFELKWDVDCGNQQKSSSAICTCPAFTDEALVRKFVNDQYVGFSAKVSDVCQEAGLDRQDESRNVIVIEDAGLQEIQHFASSISAAAGFSPPSNAIFGGDDQQQNLATSKINFRGRRLDPLTAVSGLGYASHMAKTEDGIMYFAEPETNSISVWAENVNKSLGPTFQDRRTDGEVRLRFRGLAQVDPVLQSVAGDVLPALQGVCSLQPADVNSSDVIAASGCELLFEGNAFERNTTYRSEPEWQHIVGDWVFNTGALYTSGELGPIKANRFSQHVPQSVDCTGSYCRYERPRISATIDGDACAERFATSIGPAAFRDRSNTLGAAVFTGGPFGDAGTKCKTLNSEFDTPSEHTLSAVNLIASVNEVEAMHFDPGVAAGLYISDDIDELVNGVPSASALPLAELTADILFTIGVEDLEEHPLFSAMQRKVCSDATKPFNCGCDKGLRITWRWADTAVGKLTLSMAITLERNSNDPNKYGENFLKFTETNVGPGVGFVEYFEWTSPENFAKKGDWIDLGVTYDGKYARFYNNGTILYEQHMCRASCPEDDPDCSCGNIIYPAAYHRCPQYCECPTEECKRLQCPCGSNDRGFAACHQGVDAKPGEKTFVGIGVYLENKPVRIDTHIGLIHHLRLFKKDLGPGYFRAQRPKIAKIMQNFISRYESHWFQSNGQGNPSTPLCQPEQPALSPSISYVDVEIEQPVDFMVHGYFRCLQGQTQTNPHTISYRARFSYTYRFPEERTVHIDTDPCSIQACSGPTVLNKYTDTLVCKLPSNRAWKHGYKAAVLSIVETAEFDISGEPYPTKTEAYLMSKACFTEACGWVGYKNREVQSLSMQSGSSQLPRAKWRALSFCCGHTAAECRQSHGHYLYSTAISGALSHVRFVTHSKLTTMRAANISLSSLAVSRDAVNAHDGNWVNYGVFDSQEVPFVGYSSLQMLGVSRIRSFTQGSERYMLVANYWDGKESSVLSPIIRVDQDETANPQVDKLQLTVLQGVPTVGARDMQFMRVGGVPFIMVANFEADSAIYRWRGKNSISFVDVLERGQGYIDGDVGVVCSKGPRGDACRQRAPLDATVFLARMQVDGKPDGASKKGSIESVVVTRTSEFLTDIEAEIFYSGTRIPQRESVTHMWSRPGSYVSRVRVITHVQVQPATTSGCANGTMFRSAHPSAFAARAHVSQQGSEEIDSIVVTSSGPTSESLLRPENQMCTCLLGNWSRCLVLSPDAGSFTIRSIQGGLEATADFTQGAVDQIVIANHGEMFKEEPDIFVECPSSNCTCLDALLQVQPWTYCFEMSIPRGSHRCVGGDQHDETCLGLDDTTSCIGVNQVVNDAGVVVPNSGVCREPELHPISHRGSARLSLGPVLDPPTRVSSRKFMNQPNWQEPPWISRQTPTDISIGGRISLGDFAGINGGASGLAIFERGAVTYCVVSIFLNPEKRSQNYVNSKLLRLSIQGAAGDLVPEVIQELPTAGAYDVTLLSMPYCRPVCSREMGREICRSACEDQRFFIFIPCQVGSVSPLYLWNELTSSLDLVQNVQTSRAISAGIFQYPEPLGDWYVAVGQVDKAASVLVWNGTALLGQTNVNTLPKDTAGGSNFASMTTAGGFQKFDGNAQKGIKPIILAASFSTDPSQLYSLRVEKVEGLRRPVKLAVHRSLQQRDSLSNGVSGHEAQVDRVYVACYGYSGISVLERQPNTTNEVYYRMNLAVHSTVSAADQNSTGLSLHGINDLAVQGDILYTASSLAHSGGCIHVFDILPSGELSERPSLRMLSTQSIGLRGVRALAVGLDKVFAAAAVDEAITLFSRDRTSGALTYRGHILNNERLIDRFAASFDRFQTRVKTPAMTTPFVEDYVGEPVSWYDGTFPVRLGQGTSWADSARSLTHCRVNTKELLIVLSGSAELATVSVLIYEYDVKGNAFVKHSEIEGETRTSSVESFSENDAHGRQWQYLVLANANEQSTLYRYNSQLDRFYLFNKIPINLPGGVVLPPHCADRGPGESSCDSSKSYKLPNIETHVPPWGSERPQSRARKAHAFRIDGTLYLAVATWWPRHLESGYTWFSYVYRWQQLGTTRVADNTTATGNGFELFQILPTAGSFDVQTLQVEKVGCASTTLLIIANHGFENVGAGVHVLQYSRTVSNAITGGSGAFAEVQSVPMRGISAIETFSVLDDQFLVIAAQSNFSYADSDTSESQTGSVELHENRAWGLFKWTSGRFEMFQNLSTLETGQNEIGSALAVSSLRFFTWQEESYLAIGQSLCSPADPDSCQCIAAEALCSDDRAPATILLHWDYSHGMFGEMRAVLRSNVEHDKHYHHHHEQALRCDAGLVHEIAFVAFDGLALLVLSSHRRGLLCVEWDFEHVVGMHGVEAIAVERTEKTAFAVHSVDGSMVAATVEDGQDSIGRKWTELKYVKTWTQAPMRMSRTTSTTWQHINGLAGAKGISVQEVEGCNDGHACNVVIASGPPAGEEICGYKPLLPVWEESLSTAISTPLPCQQVTFELEQLHSNNPKLFDVAPTISSDGTLRFQTALYEFGQTTLSVRLRDDGLNQGWVAYFDDDTVTAKGSDNNGAYFDSLGVGNDLSRALSFTIKVLPVNTAPRFTPVPVKMIQESLGSEVERRVVFARNVSTGSDNELQNLTFVWRWRLRYIVGWDAINAAPGRQSAILEVENQGLTDVYTYCAEQKRNLFVFTTADRLSDIGRCQDACASTPGCRYIIIENAAFPCATASTCTIRRYPASNPVLSGIFEYPGAFITVPPNLFAENDLGIMSIMMTDRVKGRFEMAVKLVDDGVDSNLLPIDDGMGSVSSSSERVVTITVSPLNIAPIFTLPVNFTAELATDGSMQAKVFSPSFAKGIGAGTGECQCGQTTECGDIIGTQRAVGVCQDLTFDLLSVQTLAGGSRPNWSAQDPGQRGEDKIQRLFQSFEIDAASGNLSFTTSAHWTGMYRVQVLATDNGDSLLGTGGAVGNANSTTMSFILIIPLVNERPSFDALDKLIINENPLAGQLQRHAYFKKVSAGSGNTDLDVVYSTSFEILSMVCLNPRLVESVALRNISCSSIFSVLPSFDASGFVSFVLNPLTHGHVHITVKAVNGGPEPTGGFQVSPRHALY